MTAVWDAATVSAVTLSGSNLVATNTGTTSTNQGAHVDFANGQTTGKFYFEVKLTTFTGGAGIAVGIGTTAAVYSTISTAATKGDMCYAVGHNGAGTIFTDLGGNSGLSIGARTTGDVIGVAVDLINRLVWFRLAPSGLWDGSSSHDPTNPGAGGGLLIPAGTIVPFITFGSGLAGQAGVAGNVFTANFGASAFVGAVPIGYMAGWPPFAPPPVELAGNLGSPSHYGRLKYGLKHYSRISAFAPIFSADLGIVPVVNFAGGLTPIIVLAADLDVHVNLIELSGGLAPQIALGGSLSLDLPLTVLEGGLTPIVVLGASSFVSGPLWAGAEPCPSPPWAPSELCPPSLWTPTGPCTPVDWEETELCNG